MVYLTVEENTAANRQVHIVMRNHPNTAKKQQVAFYMKSAGLM